MRIVEEGPGGGSIVSGWGHDWVGLEGGFVGGET